MSASAPPTAYAASLDPPNDRRIRGSWRARTSRAKILERVVLAREVPGRRLRPGPLEDLHVLAGADVAVVLAQPVALAGLLVLVAAGDDVHGDPPAADLVHRGERLGREGRDRQVRAVRDEQLQVVDVVEDVRRGLRGVRAAGRVGGEHAVPAVVAVGAGEAQRVVGVEGGAAAGPDLRTVVGGGDAEELDGHGGVSLAGGRRRAAGEPPSQSAEAVRPRSTCRRDTRRTTTSTLLRPARGVNGPRRDRRRSRRPRTTRRARAAAGSPCRSC